MKEALQEEEQMTGSSTSVILCFVVNESVFSRRRIFSGWGPLLL